MYEDQVDENWSSIENNHNSRDDLLANLADIRSLNEGAQPVNTTYFEGAFFTRCSFLWNCFLDAACAFEFACVIV